MEKRGKEPIIRKEICVPPDDLLTVPKAAEYLGVARRKIYELVEWGEIEGIKLGRSLRIKRKSLERFRASGKMT
jgi:excisionase family DNA binding protein